MAHPIRMRRDAMLLPGHLVEVLPAPAIRATLDGDFSLEGMPFMPEMLRYCGGRFRVQVRAERTCARGLPPGERALRHLEGCVVLEGLRCDGASHAGCQLGCMLFWKEAWLRRVDDLGAGRADPAEPPTVSLPVVRASDPSTYFCQGTALARATVPAGPRWDPRQYLRLVEVGTLGVGELAGMLGRSAVRRIERSLRSVLPRKPPRNATAADVLGLEPGEWVEVKSKADIRRTLDAADTHRGLGFSSDMYDFCGRKMRVSRRVDTILREETGKVRSVRDTVLLEGGECRRHLGCARQMPLMWREAWLKRLDPPGR